MSERDIRGSWKVKSRGVNKNTSPIIGMIYTSNSIVGMLISITDDQAVLRTKENKLVSVEKKSLKIVVAL
jgi:hypothetical protein